MGFSIYDILNEDDDEMSTSATTEPTSGENSEADDDFSIDTSLDDNGESDPQDAEGLDGELDDSPSDSDDLGGGDDNSGGDTSTDGDGEPNEANTDMFYSLSTDEQQMKIRELKRLYSSMFNSCNDLIERIDNTNNDAAGELISRLSSVMNDIREAIADYIIYIFPNKSYIENDTQFNIFMMYINSVSGVMEKIAQKIEKEENL